MNTLTDISSLRRARHLSVIRLMALAVCAVSLHAQQVEAAGKIDPAGINAAILESNLAESYHSANRLKEAEGLYLDALATAGKLGAAYPDIVAGILDNLARLYIDEGLYEKAQAASSRGIEMAGKISGPEGELASASALTTTAIIDLRKANLREAEAQAQKALALRRKGLAVGDPSVAECLHVLGLIYQQSGEYEKSEKTFQQALEIGQSQLNDATTRSSLGELYMDAGRFAEAEPLLRAAMEVRRKVLSPDHPLLISSLSDLALLLYYQGAMAEALALDRELVSLREGNSDGDAADTARAYNNMADVLRALQNYPEAESAYLRTVSILETQLGPDHPDVATAICNLGALYAQQRDYPRAIQRYSRALSIREKALGASHPLTLEAVANLAEVHSSQRQFGESVPLYMRALPVFRTSLPPGHPDIIATQIGLGRDLWLSGGKTEAVAQLMDANRSLAAYWSNNLTAAEDETRRGLFVKFDDLVELSLAVAEQLRQTDPKTAGNLAALAIAARKGIRSSARQELLARLRRERDPESIRQFVLLAANAEKQSRAAREFAGNGGRALKELIEEETRLKGQLVTRSLAYRQWRVSVEPAEIARKMLGRQALVDVLRYPVLDLVSLQTGPPAYAAVVYVAGGPVLVPLGPAAPIEEAVNRLRKNFDNVWNTLPCPQGERCSGANKVLKEGAEFEDNFRRTLSDCATLDALTIAKLSQAIGPAKELIISPDATLATIPWEILRDKAGDVGRYLIERGYSIRYLDSVRSFLSEQDRLAPRTEIAVIAEVDYDGGASKNITQTWKPLAGGDQIVQTLQDLRRDGKLGRLQKLPLGSKQEVLALDRPAALIVHTHGFFPEKKDEGNLGSDAADLLSGIVLYGANRAADGGLETPDPAGRLTAKEAMLLNLDGTQLAALLGCETGLGWEAGEGVQGLRHALLVAGAKSSLLTLWDVGDLSSARFLREFLVRATGSESSQEQALARTRLAFIHGEVREAGRPPTTNRWRHPYFWAAATLGGEGGALNLADLR